MFGSAVMAALDYDGKLIWRKEIMPYKFDVALAASPVLFGETVILQCDQVDKESRLVAFDRKTGAVKWAKPRPTVRFSHSTPVVATIAGKPQLLDLGLERHPGRGPSHGQVALVVRRQGRHGFAGRSAAAWSIAIAAAAGRASRSIPPERAT